MPNQPSHAILGYSGYEYIPVTPIGVLPL